MQSLIIGAGPVGSYAASLLAKHQDVSLFEEHPTVGTPIQCTGIVTHDIFRFIPKSSKFIINKINDVRIFAPDNSSLKLNFKHPDIILDRAEFDRYFFDKACANGALSQLNSRFIGNKGNVASIKDLKTGKRKSVKFDNLVGADGPQSAVAKSAGLYGNRKFFIGVQAVVKRKNDNFVDFFPSSSGFGWAVPEDSTTLRVGFASEENPKFGFERLLKRYGGRVVVKQGGLIPIYNVKANIVKDNVYLAGDAACFVKATTGGGIIPGLMSSEILANALIEGKSYSSLIKSKLAPSLSLHLKLRKAMDAFSEKDWNELVSDMNNGRSRKILEGINRDNVLPLLIRLSAANPKLFKHGFKHVRHFF